MSRYFLSVQLPCDIQGVPRGSSVPWSSPSPIIDGLLGGQERLVREALDVPPLQPDKKTHKRSGETHVPVPNAFPRYRISTLQPYAVAPLHQDASSGTRAPVLTGNVDYENAFVIRLRRNKGTGELVEVQVMGVSERTLRFTVPSTFCWRDDALDARSGPVVSQQDVRPTRFPLPPVLGTTSLQYRPLTIAVSPTSYAERRRSFNPKVESARDPNGSPVQKTSKVNRQWLEEDAPREIVEQLSALLEEQAVWAIEDLVQRIIQSLQNPPPRTTVRLVVWAMTFVYDSGPLHGLHLRFGFDPRLLENREVVRMEQRLQPRCPPGLKQFIHRLRSLPGFLDILREYTQPSVELRIRHLASLLERGNLSRYFALRELVVCNPSIQHVLDVSGCHEFDGRSEFGWFRAAAASQASRLLFVALEQWLTTDFMKRLGDVHGPLPPLLHPTENDDPPS